MEKQKETLNISEIEGKIRRISKRVSKQSDGMWRKNEYKTSKILENEKNDLEKVEEDRLKFNNDTQNLSRKIQKAKDDIIREIDHPLNYLQLSRGPEIAYKRSNNNNSKF